MNRKKLFVSNNIMNNKISISEIVKPTMSRIFSYNFLHAKLVWVDAFSLLYSKLLHAKLCLFVFGITFAASHSHFISLCCWFISDYVLLIAKNSWPRDQGEYAWDTECCGFESEQELFFFLKGNFLFRKNCRLFICLLMLCRLSCTS